MDELAKAQITRRSLVATTAAGASALALSQTGMASGGGSQGAVSTLQFQDANIPTPREETFIVGQGIVNVWDSFNPFIPNGESYQYGIAIVCREYMFYANFLTGEITPWLAESYEYNADFTQCTLHLNPNVTWNDGEPFTANDVVFTQNMLMANSQLNGAAATIRDVSAVAATDDHTVVWDLPTANPRFHYRFLAGIINDGLRVMPQHIWEAEDPGTFKFNPPVQTGPYVLRESSDSLLYYLWEKSPNYWNAANFDPAPKYVMFRQEGEVDAEVQSFLAGNIDAPGAIDYLNQQVIESQYDKTARFDFPDPCPRGLHFNCASESPLLNTAEGRWALSHLIDREVIATTIWQPSTRPANFPWADYSGWTPWAPDEVTSQFDWSFSVDKANEILDGMGATERDGDTRILNGQPLRLTMITSAQTTGLEYQIGQSFANTAKEAGIDIEVKSLPGSAHGDVFNVGDYDISSRWICGMQFDPNQLFTQFHSRNFKPIGERVDGDAASTRLQSPELDALIEQLDVIDVEAEESKPVFNDALNVWLQELPMAPIIQTTYPMFYNTAYWTGYPSAEDPYTIPARWWGQFMFAIGRLQPAGS